MARNGISILPTKEARQIAKLDLASTKRGESYDITLLPTTYDGNILVNNPNTGGLQPHRPWTTGPVSNAYPQRTNYAFDFVTPPTSGTVWNDDVNQVSITIYGAGTRTSSFGRGIVFNGTDTYLEVLDNTIGVSTVTISMAADFQSAGGNWNPIYHGGPYGSNDVFAYITGGNTDSMSVGTGQTFDPPGAIVNNGLAWWDFVYNGTSVTVYKNGVQVLTGTLNTANSAFNQNILFGARYNGSDINNGDFLNGTIYRIKGVLSALDSSAITTQYNSIRTTYSLPAVPVTYTYTATQSANNSGSNAVHIDTNPTNDAWASTVPVGATIVADLIGTFTVTGVITPTDPGNISANWFFVVTPNNASFFAGAALTFTWTV